MIKNNFKNRCIKHRIGCSLVSGYTIWANKANTLCKQKIDAYRKQVQYNRKRYVSCFMSMQIFKAKLRGRRFTLDIDHQALTNIRYKRNFDNQRINRWVEKIQTLDFDIKYIKGENMGMADSLSRETR